MVRIIIYLIFILFSCLSANANKIQDCFYECCFGSSYDEIMGKLVLQDYEVEKHASYLAVEGVFLEVCILIRYCFVSRRMYFIA